MASSTYLRIYGSGEIPADHASRVLTFVSGAYDGLWFMDYLRTVGRNDARRVAQIISSDLWWPDNVTASELLPPSNKSLELRGVVLQSPGFWEFAGTLNPLEAIRKFLNDRHERKKDKAYRNTLEAEKLYIENSVLRAKAIADTADALRKAGVPEDQIYALLRDLVIVPFHKLESLQDRNLISYAELVSPTKATQTEDADA